MTRSAGFVGALTSAPRPLWSRRGGAACDRVRAHPATPGTRRLCAPLAALSAGAQVAAARRRGAAMGLFDRLRGGGAGGAPGRRATLDRGSARADLTHLEQFAATRRGVEG